MKQVIDWFEIPVSDMSRAQAFYEVVLQTTLQRENFAGPNMQMVVFKEDGQRAKGALISGHPALQPGTSGTLVYFHVDDCAVVLERARVLGAPIHRDKWSIGADGFIAIIGDSEGNAIGLHSFQ